MTSNKHYQFLALARSIADIFSTCGKKQHAAILVDDNNSIIATGYNGVPPGFKHCVDGGCPRFQEGSKPMSSYDNCYAVHAETNAILRSDYSARPTRIYVTGAPCFDCTKVIANTTVSSIYFIDDGYFDEEGIQKSVEFLQKADMRVFRVAEEFLIQQGFLKDASK